MSVNVKICGVTNLRDARVAVAAGADFLGFVFYKKSPRYIPPSRARRLISRLPRTVRKVGVFVNEDKERVKAVAASCGLDMVQFHGTETPAYVNSFKGCGVIKAVRVRDRRSLEGLDRYRADFFLLDTFRRCRFGGTGATFAWKVLAPLADKKAKIIVSGGLTPENVGGFLKVFRPYGVDVSSGVEKAPGKKDHKRVKRFIDAVKGFEGR
ncbi:phosphoribosylanthranilate isomerase [Candidatus Velamenicoccus archaeovorus]|uniref:N-(5'-phosphoribosyl)anthranilate isomerase n=1 Tax=Velamenicoccus archaeovorus TaxID=1930593 RepID=A0A410P2S7_VELA1|nr:phosphoribosylanthranilate isomerase [Candidatus Velamenicoccus archaeovorus]QAT16469.1 phosphoribosylanthranilate isomerase [Candidatus Velamenicoccus archaeovorus]